MSCWRRDLLFIRIDLVCAFMYGFSNFIEFWYFLLFFVIFSNAYVQGFGRVRFQVIDTITVKFGSNLIVGAGALQVSNRSFFDNPLNYFSSHGIFKLVEVSLGIQSQK